jgi:hypothetical protein
MSILKVALIFFLIHFALFAQKEERYEKEDNQEQQEYDKEFTYGLNWNTNGSFLGGINLKFAWQLKQKQTQYHFVGLEIVGVVHPRELSRSGPLQSYVMEKMGTLYVIRPHFGREIVIFNKAEEEGVQISWMNAIGLSLGYLKPYYVALGRIEDVIENGQVVGQTIASYREAPYRNGVVNTNIQEEILGSAGFFKGFDEMGNYTGFHVKTSLNFEYGKFKNSVAGVEIGALFELMPKKIMLINNAENRQFFSSLFVNIYYGIR